MGKTGTTLWAQVKGVKGQIRLVPKKEGEAKTPGPNQRFKAVQMSSRSTRLQKRWADAVAAADVVAGAGVAGTARGGSGMNESTANPMIRRRMRRAKVSALGAKAKSSR